MTGHDLKTLRERAGLTQVQLALFLNVHPNTVAKWEQGYQSIPMPRLVRFGLAMITDLLIAADGDIDQARADWHALTA